MSKSIVKPKDQRCAPSQNYEAGSCIPLHILEAMAISYNKKFDDIIIKLNKNLKVLNPTKYKRYLLKQFNDKTILGRVCDDQLCWINKDFDFINNMNPKLINELKTNVYRPTGPKGKYTWLNTININKVLEQYEKKYNNFKSFGAVPIDFNKLDSLGIKDIDFNDLLNNNKYKIGVVFNLDEHDESGSHWVSLYSDIKSGHIYFFDSYGSKPEKRIQKFMRKIANFYKKKFKKEPTVDSNEIRHQFGNNACGVYSLNFIVRLLKGESYKNIVNNITKDNEMNINRQVYFI